MENYNQNQIDYDIAKSRVNSIKRFYISLAFFILFSAIWVVKDFIKINFYDFNPVGRTHWIFWIWGAFLAVRAVKLFIFDTNWERKMISKELKK